MGAQLNSLKRSLEVSEKSVDRARNLRTRRSMSSTVLPRVFGSPWWLCAAALRVTKSATMRLFGWSDYKRWENSESYLAWWSSRTERIARLIPDGSRVLEFGAGTRLLESFLAHGCEYVSFDLIDRGPGTVICDLNQRPLPRLSYLQSNVAVFSGVLEYINDLPSLVGWLSRQTPMCIASYECVKSRPYTAKRVAELVRRAYHGYMSYYTEQMLVSLFKAKGFSCTAIENWRDQKLFVFQIFD